MESFAGAVLSQVKALEVTLRAANDLTEARLSGIEKSHWEMMDALRELLQPRPGPLYM